MIIKAIDTLEFGIDIENYTVVMEPLLTRLKELKEISQLSLVDQEISIGNLTLSVGSTGVRFYAFRLTCKDFSICFMDREIRTNPPVKVKLMSSFLWSFGYEKCLALFLDWFNNLGATVLRTRLSRLDPCFDTDEVSFVYSDIKCVVSKAMKKGNVFVPEEFFYGREFSGFTVGRGGPLSARIYNKSLEIKNSGKNWFLQIWHDNDWDESKHVWRVEFQLRREILKEFGIDSVLDISSKLDALWVYLTTKWLVIKSPSKGNVSRRKIKRKWKLVQKSGPGANSSPLTREMVKMGNLDPMLNQVYGLVLSIAASANHSTIKETMKVVETVTNMKLSQKRTTFQEEKKRRQQRFLKFYDN